LKKPRAVGVQFRYAFVTDDEGFKVLDITEPTKPKLIPGAFVLLKHAQRFYLVRTFAYVADGEDGLQIIQLISPENVPGHMGFSPAPNPKLMATFPTQTPAVAVGRGLDRDRVVDESGNQTVVFGRKGSRPFKLTEMKKFYEHDGELYRVENVFTRDGKLMTSSGIELKPTADFQPVEAKTVSPLPDNERLRRRGQ
jgi:hypothetical protein